jgi:hypothetical protein
MKQREEHLVDELHDEVFPREETESLPSSNAW